MYLASTWYSRTWPDRLDRPRRRSAIIALLRCAPNMQVARNIRKPSFSPWLLLVADTALPIRLLASLRIQPGIWADFKLVQEKYLAEQANEINFRYLPSGWRPLVHLPSVVLVIPSIGCKYHQRWSRPRQAKWRNIAQMLLTKLF